MAEVPLPTPTQAPVPSTDIRNAVFAGAKLDEEVTGLGDFYTDRLGAKHLTNTGRNNQFQDAQNQRESDFVASQADKEARFQQFLLNSGYQFLGDYENGPYTINARNQIIRYQNEFWRLNAATNPPYTTTGINNTSWATDITHLVSVGDANLRQELSFSSGLKLIGQCASIAALRAISFASVGQQVFVKEHTSGMGQGGGIFYCHSLTNLGSLADDNGFQIVTASGQVLRRKDRNIMSAEMFGAIGGQDITPVLNNMLLASKTFNIQEAYIPHPLNKTDYTASGGSVADVTDGIGFNLIGLKMVNKGPAINHISNNIFFRFRKNGPGSSSFYEQCSVTGLLIRGRNAANTAAGNDGYAIEASDIIGFYCDLFCTGYTNTAAAAVSIYNDTSFTEQSRIKLHIRNCCNGVHFHRNASTGATSTNSFMGTELDLSFQAAVSGKANNGIVVGNLDGTATSNTFDVNLYASKIKMKYWAEGGSATRAILVTAKGIVPESTTFDLISDGYGFGTSDTDTTTDPATQLIRVENGGIFRAKCTDQSMQTGLSHRLNQLQRLRNSIFSFQDDTYKVPYNDARPYINPVGMSCICSGTIDVATQQAGASWQISGLPMGMRIRVTINQYLEGEPATSVQEVWEVLVRGDAQSVICTPLVTNDVLTTTTGLAVVNSSFATATFLKSVAAAFGKFWQGDSTRTRLTVRNNNDDNSLTTGSSDGRKFRIFLPVNASATSVLHYSVKLEVV
ncbi:phage tail fiber protein [Klebsiella pneumoniae]|uniref:phage tail fiber protein n=1 Tax=Klebsiella pneumoniae TaxID=573 RepID=UPI001EFB88EA|nr:phage tail fiber protein [Klebsiella pneumoniae]WLY12786.1 phage tail fiber protein [Klebsiella pneumoniae]WLY23842.1 phage tail fiber protein [Klebsiella pneumoniae]